MKAIYTYSEKIVGICTCILLLMSTGAQAQTPAVEFDAEKYVPPYTLAAPQGWNIERFAIPIEFAPSIPYKGVEDVRFAPGWADPKSNEYWAYAFLWNLEGSPEISPEITEKNLTAYYTGLIGRNIDRRKIPKEKLVPVKVTLKKTSADEGDLQTYSGTVDMLDYMEQKPIILNCIVHVKSCPGKSNLFVFYQISPQPSTSQIWKDLRNLWTTFGCDAEKK
jgi:hypothetical protein